MGSSASLRLITLSATAEFKIVSRAWYVTAMAPELPASLFAQLRTEGKMVIPIGTLERQSLDLITKVAGKPVAQHLCGCLFVKLIGSQGWDDSVQDRRDIE